ncbi:hypothetical protein BDN70DRAFT_795185 [Pholiota conissans]|uniref:Zn(2)-C6 fungal-type domain-containing protein n=1 Tax=Pholiota conissans TaxID=109636 RepID=A0A9P5ZG77_9AGAR|nr:hypothetical protein BDN70DRAFT_795185 [Pholiota conissans]
MSPDTFSHSFDRRAASSSDLRAPSDIYHAHNYAESSRSHYSNVDRPRDNVVPSVLDTYAVSAHSTFASEPNSAATGPSSEHSGESDFWPVSTPDTRQLDAPKPKKGRREKPRIELAPDQPPTTQGKPRARVYVACLQCRTRKIRCDGAKPVCHNCGRRATGGNECNYDPVPKRRGPDKTPGARQRMARDVKSDVESVPRRRRRTQSGSASEIKPSISELPQSHYHSLSTGNRLHLEIPPGLPDSEPPAIAGGGTPISHYSRPSYSPCACHGATHCPSLLGIGSLSDPRKPVSITTNYHDGFDLVNIIPPYSTSNQSYISELDENVNEREDSNCRPRIASEPSLNFSRKIWWDSLLSLYLSPDSSRLQALTPSQRHSAAQSITADLRFVFRASNYWFSFFHIPTFFNNYFDTSKRDRIQPSLVLALLALSTFWQSSEIGYGKDGRERAMRFRVEAQAAMEASFNAGWVDETLAQTAWLLALFEVCANPLHSSQRSSSSMVVLDSIIRTLKMTLVDASDPSTTVFTPGSVPVVNTPKSCSGLPGSSPTTGSSAEDVYNGSPIHQTPHPGKGCSCNLLTLGEHWPGAQEHAPLWSCTPAWDESWSEAEIRKESCRRLCWSAMILAAGHSSYSSAHQAETLDLFIADPANYALLFSGESVARSPALSKQSPKDTIWALHDRSFLLWHGCIRMRNNHHATDNEKSEFAVRAWLEADALEQALNRHTCSIERAFIFQAREYIFNTRMCISYEFRRYVPLVTNVNGMFHRTKAEEWLTHQAIVAERFMHGLHTVTGNSNNLLARRPFFVFWFMGQIHRALALYECDTTLTVALEVCKALIPAIDYLTSLWPCNEQRYRYKSVRNKVASSCFNAGIEPPAPFDILSPTPASPDHLI